LESLVDWNKHNSNYNEICQQLKIIIVDIVILKSRAFYIMATLLLRQAQVSGDFCYIVVLLRTIYIDQHEHLKFENKKK